MSVGEGQQESLAPSATPKRSADYWDRAPGPHGAQSGQPRNAGRTALTVLGAITACAATALACTPGAATAAATVERTRTGEVSASVQSGPAARISTLAVILPADGDAATAFARCAAEVSAAITKRPAHWRYWASSTDLAQLGLILPKQERSAAAGPVAAASEIPLPLS